jgi:glycine/D-amino acid oxidase-like deaminating enzyme
MVNVPMYLDYLYRTAQSLGAIVIRHALPTSGSFKESLSAAADILVSHSKGSVLEISAFVNATGISARNLVPDSNVYPVSGQTVTVCGEAKQITTVEATPSNPAFKNPIVYVLPRPHSNTTIIGGTKQVASWKAEPDPEVTAEILRRAKDWCPELLNESGEFEVISEQVGLRPARGGGVRVEMENTDGFVVCHAYGHAGAGYQNSVGSANKVVKLLENWLQKT